MSEITWVRRVYWSVRREVWEHPSLWIAPLATAGVSLLAVAVARVTGPKAQATALLTTNSYDVVIGVIMLAAYAAAVFYALDALHGERRDRSILFWKSLPVSDVTTVVTKFGVALLLVPLITAVITLATLVLMLPLTPAHPPLGRTSALLLYHLFTVHSLWWAPFFGWLFMISAAARRAPIVWAVVPLIVVAFVERIAFGTTFIGTALGTRFTASPEAVVAHGMLPTDAMSRMTPDAFARSPGLWIGLFVATALGAAAVRLRRRNGPA